MKLTEKLYSRAMNNFQSGDYDEALEEIENCVQMLRKSTVLVRKRDGPDFERFVDAKILQGRIYSAKGDQEQVEEVLKYLRTLNMGNEKSTQYAQGRVYYFLYDFGKQNEDDNADQYLEKAKDSFVMAQQYVDAIEILFDLERAPDYKNDARKLMQLYDEIVDLTKRLSDKKTKQAVNGRVHLQIAKLFSRSDSKKSKKAFEKAYTELSYNPYLQIESLVFLAAIDLYDSPKKARKLIDQIKENELSEYNMSKVLLLDLLVKIVEEDESINQDFDLAIKSLNGTDVDMKLADQILDTATFIAIYGEDSQKSRASEILKFGIDAFDKTGDKHGKVIAYAIEGLLATTEEDKENKIKLVDVYSKSLKEVDSPYLRSQSLDIIHWIGNNKKPNKEIIEEIKHHYDDRIKQAEAMKLVAMYKSVKEDEIGNSDELYDEAKKLFKKSKFQYSNHAIDRIESMKANN